MTRGLLLVAVIFSCGAYAINSPTWAIGPVERYANNPVMMSQGDVGLWDLQNAYNHAIISRNMQFYVLYRGENSDKLLLKYYRSQIGYATNNDGINGQRYEGNPVLRAQERHGLSGGLEDPRLIEYKGTYYCYYIEYSPDDKGVILSVTSSSNLKNRTKYDPIYDELMKNGAIHMALNNHPIKIDGKFVMYTSDVQMFIGFFDNLINWEFEQMEVSFSKAFYPMECCMPLGNYEKNGSNITLFFGGRLGGGKGIDGVTWHYALGKCLMKRGNVRKIVEIMNEPFMIPSEPYAQKGFINYTLFFETLTRHNGELCLYSEAADHQIGLAKAKVKR